VQLLRQDHNTPDREGKPRLNSTLTAQRCTYDLSVEGKRTSSPTRIGNIFNVRFLLTLWGITLNLTWQKTTIVEMKLHIIAVSAVYSTCMMFWSSKWRVLNLREWLVNFTRIFLGHCGQKDCFHEVYRTITDSSPHQRYSRFTVYRLFRMSGDLEFENYRLIPIPGFFQDFHRRSPGYLDCMINDSLAMFLSPNSTFLFWPLTRKDF